ncbi:hypothetical protein TRVL_05528 [Trypanosoma vivax]|nr:hypothetical protein TRVL_05528 [Trypanosoma vivax]
MAVLRSRQAQKLTLSFGGNSAIQAKSFSSLIWQNKIQGLLSPALCLAFVVRHRRPRTISNARYSLKWQRHLCTLSCDLFPLCAVYKCTFAPPRLPFTSLLQVLPRAPNIS